MKSTILLFSILMVPILSCPLLGQKTITQVDFAQAGTSVGISTSNDPVDYNTTGADIVWDFSDLGENSQLFETFHTISSGGVIIQLQFGMFAPTIYQASYYQPYDGLPFDQFGSLLPVNIEAINKLTKVTNDQVNTVGYSFKVNGQQVGFRSDTIETYYELPLQYGDSSSSRGYTNFDFNPIYDAQFIQHRNHLSVVDGYGQLITPFDTYDNVIRVHHTIKEKDSLRLTIAGFSQWIPINRTINEYEWWDNGKKRPVLKIETEGIANNEVPTRITFINNQVAGLDVNTIETAIYPNPSSNLINIESEENLKSIEIWSLDGKSVFQTNCSGKDITINVTNIAAGMYTLQLISEKGESFKPIVIK